MKLIITIQTHRYYSTDNKIVPIKSYLNSYENRNQIFKENNNKSGIYLWLNLITNKRYVGSSINLTSRLRNYLSNNHMKNELIRYNSHIFNALIKYGYDNFKLDIITYADIKELIHWEQHYIDSLKPEYNILPSAGSTLGYKHKQATIVKLKNYKPSLEALTKLRLSKENYSNKILVINKKTNNLTMFKSVRAAARYLNVSHPGLEYSMDNNILLKNTYSIIKFIKIKF